MNLNGNAQEIWEVKTNQKRTQWILAWSYAHSLLKYFTVSDDEYYSHLSARLIHLGYLHLMTQVLSRAYLNVDTCVLESKGTQSFHGIWSTITLVHQSIQN